MVLSVQIGMSEKSVLRDFHPDAEDLYNVTMDLSNVCRELKDRNKRMPRRVWHILSALLLHTMEPLSSRA